MSEIDNNGSSNDTCNTLDMVATKPAKNIYVPDYIDTIFQRLDAQDVEHFYKSYHFWSLQQRLKMLQTEIGVVQQAIADNDTVMQQMQLSAIALSSLAQLQASGVNDPDLLDRMLERGETWLDHTMQLLEQCEELDVIGGDYTQWCEHALEGAYDWVESINALNTLNAQDNDAETLAISYERQAELQAATEEELLQKLMSDEEATIKIPVPSHLFSKTEQIESSLLARKITQPLQPLEQEATELSLPTRKITQPLQSLEQEATELSLPTRKITQPLLQIEDLAEAEIPETPSTDEFEEVESGSLQITSPDNEFEEVEFGSLQTISPDNEFEEVEFGSLQTISSTDEPDHVESSSLQTISPDNELLQEGPLDVPTDTSIIASKPLQEERSDVSTAPQILDNELLQEEQPDVPTDTSEEESITQKMVVSQIGPVTTSKDADVQEVKDVAVSEENSDQTRAESFALIQSPQESKKPQIQKVRQRGFWGLLSRLIAFILRR